MEFLIGIVGGLASGFFGTGGGLIIHPSLTRILKLDEYKARGTTLLAVFPAVIVASLVYLNNYFVDTKMIIKVVVSGCIGGFIGAKIMNKIPEFYLSLIFDFFIIIASIKIIFQG